MRSPARLQAGDLAGLARRGEAPTGREAALLRAKKRGMGSHLCSEEWGTKLREVALEKQMMNKLVMDYLVIEGHKDAAARFMSESGTPCDSCAAPFREVDLDSIVDRVSIRTALEAGNVEDAVEGTNNLDLQ
eukprot:6184926-Pleurochrysis_carterae.AAC.4